MMDILSPMNVTETYMQEHYDLWYNKPHSSRFFFEHFHNHTVQVTNDSDANTCRCSNVSFTYWESFPNVTSTWSLQKQAELKDYLSDVKQFKNMFCEELCGDIMVHHATISRNIRESSWLVDQDRFSSTASTHRGISVKTATSLDLSQTIDSERYTKFLQLQSRLGLSRERIPDVCSRIPSPRLLHTAE